MFFTIVFENSLHYYGRGEKGIFVFLWQQLDPKLTAMFFRYFLKKGAEMPQNVSLHYTSIQTKKVGE